MPTRFLSDAQLSRLTGWPAEITTDDLVAFFTIDWDDVAWLRRQRRDPGNLLGLAVQLCALPWLGFVPDNVDGCPMTATGRLADTLGLGRAIAPGLLAGYGGFRGETRRAHFRLVLDRLGWRTATGSDRKQLDELLLARAVEHDSPTVLLEQAGDWLRRERIVRPGPDRLARRVAAAREAAHAVTYQRLVPLLDAPRATALDGLLVVDRALGSTRLAWLRTGATAATTEVIRTELAKLAFLRDLGADELDAGLTAADLPRARRRFLAEIGRRSTNTALARSEPARRHPVLLATLAETYAEVLDELVQVVDQALAGADARPRPAARRRPGLARRPGGAGPGRRGAAARPDRRWTGFAPRSAPPPTGRRRITGSCQLLTTGSCGCSLRRCSTRCRWPATPKPPRCSPPSRSCANWNRTGRLRVPAGMLTPAATPFVPTRGRAARGGPARW